MFILNNNTVIGNWQMQKLPNIFLSSKDDSDSKIVLSSKTESSSRCGTRPGVIQSI